MKRILVIFVLGIFLWCNVSYAWWGHDRYRYYHGRYYGNGIFGAVLFTGTIVASLPKLCIDSVAIGDNYYYYCNGIYYQNHRNNYIVVEDPYMVVQTNLMNSPPVQNQILVNVPNNTGGYNSVVLNRASNGIGWIGPQGEMYNNFPTVQQLEVMYGN